MVAGGVCERQRARTHWWGVSVIDVRDVVGCGWCGGVLAVWWQVHVWGLGGC